MIELTDELFEVLTDAMVYKTRFINLECSEDEILRNIIQQVIVDTWLTADGSITPEQWKSERAVA